MLTNINLRFWIFLTVVSTLLLAACNNKKQQNPNATTTARTIRNLAAPADVVNRTTGQILQANPFVYFNIASGETIPASQANTTNWDIAFKGTRIIVNSGISGPGSAAAGVFTGTFDELNTIADNFEFRQDSQASLAIIPLSGQGWYNYNAAANLITPIPGRVIVIRTADGRFAKMEIISYYQDAPTNLDANIHLAGFYTFRYAYQANGSRKF